MLVARPPAITMEMPIAMAMLEGSCLGQVAQLVEFGLRCDSIPHLGLRSTEA
jgi:hypothetical protein